MNDIERAINGMKGFYMILEPLLLKVNYEEKGKEDVAELKEDIGLAISALEKQLNNGWIPVSERLPEEDLDVLVFDKYKDMHIAHYKPDEGWILTSNQLLFVSPPVAWQPLPEPYKEEEE